MYTLLKSDYDQYTKLIDSNITKDAYDSFLDNVLGENHQIIVIRKEGNLVGAGTLFVEPKLTYGGCMMGHIENVLVHADYRGKGYGEVLVDSLLELAKEKGCYRVDLNCTAELHTFYQKNGFKEKHICMNIYIKENFTS